MRKVWLPLLTLLLLGVPVLARQEAYSLESINCPFDTPEGEVEGETMECAVFTVPEDHNDPDGQLIQLVLAILYSPNEDYAPDPLLYLSGGPGASALLDIEGWTAYPMRENRDIILLDQRGTGFSAPNIDCFDDVQACYDGWVDEGVNLSAYNSIQSAADVATLRAALGYDEWNLMGISYGTRLALVIMRDFPEGIRSVILDLTYPPVINDWEEVSSDEVDAFSTLFAGCAADPVCDSAYPDLETVFYETLVALNDEPVIYEGTDVDGNVTEITLDGYTLEQTIFQALYATYNLPYLPAVIYAASYGDYTMLDDLNSGAILDRNHALQDGEMPDDSADGLFNSITCAEEIPFVDYDVAIADAESTREEVRNGLVEAIESMYETCGIWVVDPAPDIEAEAVVSDIPTLVLAGEYDPVTPVRWGELAAETLSSSYLFAFPGVGHGVIDGGDCPQSIIVQFLDDPYSEPDGSCIDEMGAPEFVIFE